MDVALLTIGYTDYLMPADHALQVQALLLQHAWTADGSHTPGNHRPVGQIFLDHYQGRPVAQPRVRCRLLEPSQLLEPLAQRAPMLELPHG